jgi:hypothetical protein
VPSRGALLIVLLGAGCFQEEEIPPGLPQECSLEPPTGCATDVPFCCLRADDGVTYCVAEPLVGDEWSCARDPDPGSAAHP